MTRQEFHGFHHPTLRASTADLLDEVRDVAVFEKPQLGKRERRPRSVATQSLAPDVVMRRDRHGRVKVEPEMGDDVALQIVWGTDGRAVRDVVVAGEIVVRNGRSTRVEEHELAVRQ